MKSQKERVIEFVKYHINGDGECNNVVLKQWADDENLTLQERYELAFYFSVTYCVESSIVLFKGIKQGNDISKLKPHLIFQSDRKYMRMKDNFERCMHDFKNHNKVDVFFEEMTSQGVLDLEKAIKTVQTWTMYGRFASFLFLETLAELTGIKIKNTTIYGDVVYKYIGKEEG